MKYYNVEFPGLGISFRFSPVAFSLGNFEIKWYGIIIAIGFILALFYVTKSAKRFNLNSDKLINVIIFSFFTGIIGARLYYVIFYPGDYYINNPVNILFIHEGGLAVYGGIIGGIIGGLIFSRFQRINILAGLDIASLGLLIGQSIGRWGNFMNQEAFGTKTSLPWRMVSENTYGVGVHPCFLYESIWCFLGFLILHFFSRKFRRYNGQIFLMYLLWYGFGRFFIEGLRTDSLYLISSDIKISQLIAVITVIASGILLFIFRKKNNLKRYKY